MTKHEKYISRCMELAERGAGEVAPNPMVGAVLVYEDKIIGEGYHQRFGEAHAEVNCINTVRQKDLHLIRKSTLYVSLEPCSHFGKTPPCVDLIIRQDIPEVIIGCRDPFEEVNGSGIEGLKAAGIKVEDAVMEKACKDLNRRFFTFHQKKRPYIILKWAQSADFKIAGPNSARVKISNEFTDRLVHQWRVQESAILIGTNTAIIDNPLLTARLWPGKNPLRILLDQELKTPANSKVFNDDSDTVILNSSISKIDGSNLFLTSDPDLPSILKQIVFRENHVSYC